MYQPSVDHLNELLRLEVADKITKAATTRGTDFHTLTENHLYNHEDTPKVPPISNFLFKVAKAKINNIPVS